MIRRTIFGALAVAASLGTAFVVKTLLNKEENEEEDEEEVRFITITDDDEEPQMYDASERSEEVRKVCAVYPYLDPDFVETVLEKNNDLNARYEEDTLVTLEHTVSFKDSAGKEKFTDILESSGYSCSEKDGSTTAKKKLFTEDGAIVSDILNVANQAAVLGGTYKDYDVYQ